ncbi:hypothetical protein DKX38_023927 [Salix brachista]|uniref:Uncharacterized protein n=1 Tax=Salix brachista TaxID=2182728 RepID=A0A5N5JK41_9ROSI|nr:hypothetical protein DKX38_023927 [Salix brachista]
MLRLTDLSLSFKAINERDKFIIINDGDDYGESPFYVTGWNSYWLMMESVRSSSRPKVSPGVFNERVFKSGE